jgi:hypothetical protein
VKTKKQEDKMKTKSDSLSPVIYRRVLATLRRRIRYVAAISLVFVGLLLTSYRALAKVQRGDKEDQGMTAGVPSTEDDTDPEYPEKQHQFLDWFLGTGSEGVSPSAYASALAAARVVSKPFCCKTGSLFRADHRRSCHAGHFRFLPRLTTIGAILIRGLRPDFQRMGMFNSILIAPILGMFRLHNSNQAIGSK